MNFLGNQKFCGSRTATKTYEQIHNLLVVRCDRHDVYSFLPKPGNHCDHNGTRSRQTDTDAVENAALQNNRGRGTKKSAEDGGFSI
jgi:hypothetical protein